MMAMSTGAYGFSIDGELSTAYEWSKDEDEETETLWENYLRIDNAALIGPYLDVSIFGKYSQEGGDDGQDGEEYTDIYSAYLHYSSFQGAVELNAGRFPYVNNKFLTLDGGEFTVRTDYYLGATVFGGIPKYFDMDDRHINETFRDTGDRLYGGKLFLNGIKFTNAYVAVSREENEEQIIQELIGAGIDQGFNLGRAAVTAGAKMAYDKELEDIYRGVIRLHMTYGDLTVLTDGTRYNVQEGTTFENELVISNFSVGQEDRLSYTVKYAVTESIIPYQSTVLTRMEVADGAIIDGEIFKLGVDIDYFKKIGVTSNVEGYYYNSEVSTANGGSLALEWNITRSLRMIFEGELLKLENPATTDETYETDEEVYSVYLTAEYDILKDVTVSIFGENNKETRYLPENRYGIKAAYRF
jgi:hypothetical protein